MIKQAVTQDIPIIESILLNAVKWMDENGLHQWEKENIQWQKLSKYYNVDDFYIAYYESIPVACMALIDYDPAFWSDIPRGESLYIHKIAVKREYARKGFSKELIDFAKTKAKCLDINAIRLDCHKTRYKVRAIYEKQGFVCVEEKTLFGRYETALYIYNLEYR